MERKKAHADGHTLTAGSSSLGSIAPYVIARHPCKMTRLPSTRTRLCTPALKRVRRPTFLRQALRDASCSPLTCWPQHAPPIIVLSSLRIINAPYCAYTIHLCDFCIPPTTAHKLSTMAALDNERLGLVFATRPDILEGIKQAAGALMTLTPPCYQPWLAVVASRSSPY